MLVCGPLVSERPGFAASTHLYPAVIFEIARSEIGYTDQRPAEYAAVVLAAAIRESWQAPVFLQGDHYQTNAKKMNDDPKKEIAAIEALIDGAPNSRTHTTSSRYGDHAMKISPAV